MKTVKLDIDGQLISAQIMRQGSTLWAHINGRTVAYEVDGAKSSKKKQAVEDPTKVFSPMPGKIIKVLCAENDKVVKNQTLVVMEAMKMEYSLKAQADGVIKKMRAVAGGQAALGDLLVELEPT